MAKYLCEEDMNTGEYISRDKILKAIHSYCENCNNHNGVMCRACDNADNMDIIIDIPAADVQPVKRGRWIKQEGFWNKNTVKCSLCGNYLDMNGVNGGRSDANFCPNCGARMEGKTNDINDK